MKACIGSGLSLTLALEVSGQFHVPAISPPPSSTKKTTGLHWRGILVCPRAGLH